MIHNEWLSMTASIHSINFGASRQQKVHIFIWGGLRGGTRLFLPHATPVEPPLLVMGGGMLQIRAVEHTHRAPHIRVLYPLHSNVRKLQATRVQSRRTRKESSVSWTRKSTVTLPTWCWITSTRPATVGGWAAATRGTRTPSCASASIHILSWQQWGV